MKIMTVLGARPQFIKAAAVSNILRNDHTECLVHTGQHFEPNMSELFFRELNVPMANYDLGISGGSHSEQTGRMMIKLEKVIGEEKPDMMIVYGDTNSTLAGALVASKMNIPIAHVEAGLRSFDPSMPEEVNRIIVDKLSDILFAPTPVAMKNLKKEGQKDSSYLVGDVMYDIFKKFEERIYNNKRHILKRFGLEEKKFCLLTIHRQANVDSRKNLRCILEGLEASGENFAFPVHPRTRSALTEVIFDNVLKRFGKRLTRTQPLGYLDFLSLACSARLIVTDSGGVQKEAYMLHVPCLTLRPSTEWTETVDRGWNRLIDLDADVIRQSVRLSFRGKRHRRLYGDGDAGQKIVDIITRKSLDEDTYY